MADTTTLNETGRSPVDGSESVRLATAGANWKATINAIFTARAFIGSARVTAVAVGSLPGSPVLGMIATVNDALVPVIGSTVSAGGAAKALVWWNGAAWSVIGV